MKHVLLHCSDEDLGPTLTAQRRLPRWPANKEPPVPRLCACRTLAGCFAARLFTLTRDVHVYSTLKPVGSNEPKSVWDALITSERWIVPPLTLHKVQIVPAEQAMKAQAVAHLRASYRFKSTWRTRIAQRAIAYTVLGGPAWEGRMLQKWLRTWLSSQDPEEYCLRLLDEELTCRSSAPVPECAS